MLKSHKRLASLFLAIVLLFSLVTSAYAANIPAGIDSNIVDKVKTALNVVSKQKEQFGLSNVDMTTLSIGNEILAYEYSNDKLTPLGFSIYPLSSNNTLVALAVKDNYGSINITTALADKIKEHISSDTAFALVYDSNTCYGYTKDGLAELAKSSEISENRGIISDKRAKYDSVQLENFAAIQSIGYKDTSAQNATTSIINSVAYINLNVPFVTQNPVSKICMAACVASIGKYLTGYNYTARAVSEYQWGVGNNWDRSMSNAEALKCLRDLYGVYYTDYSVPSVPTIPSDNTITASLNSNRPLFGFWSWTHGAHATVICGIDAIAGYISMMDPEFGFTSALTNGSTYTYTSVWSGIFYTLNNGYMK